MEKLFYLVVLVGHNSLYYHKYISKHLLVLNIQVKVIVIGNFLVYSTLVHSSVCIFGFNKIWNYSLVLSSIEICKYHYYQLLQYVLRMKSCLVIEIYLEMHYWL